MFIHSIVFWINIAIALQSAPDFQNIFDLFYKEGGWVNHIRQIKHVGESQKLYDVFTSLRTKKENMALVMRGNKILGMVTLEDIIREIITSIIKD